MAAVAAVVLMVSAQAGAQTKRGERARVSAQAQIDAARLLSQGREGLRAGDFAGAERALTDAYLKVPGPLPLYYLGLVWAQKGAALLAHDLLRRFEADPAAEPDGAMQTELRRILSEAPPPHGKVQVLGEPGAVVRIGGHLIGSLPLLQPALVPPDARQSLTVEAASPRDGKEVVIPVSVSVPPGRLVEVRVNTASRAALVTLLPAYIVVPQLGGIPEALQQSAVRTLEQGLQAEKKSMLLPDVALLRAPQLAGCLQRIDCLLQLAEKNEAEGVFVVRVESTGVGRYRYRIELLDTVTGEPAASQGGDVEMALIDGALRQSAVRQALEVAARPRGTLKVRTEPAGADVYLGERSLGKTPLSRIVFGGTLELSLRKAEHEPVAKRVLIEDGQTAEISETLSPQSAEPPPHLAFAVQPTTQLVQRPRPTWRLVAGGVGVGLGLVLGGFGVNAISVHNTCFDPSCTFLFNTSGAAGALLGSGTAALLAGTVLLALPGRREPIDVYAFPAASVPLLPAPSGDRAAARSSAPSRP